MKTGLFGSFQASQLLTRGRILPSGPLYLPEYRVAAAVANPFRSAAFRGATFQPRAAFAHGGVPMIENTTCIPLFAAKVTVRS